MPAALSPLQVGAAAIFFIALLPRTPSLGFLNLRPCGSTHPSRVGPSNDGVLMVTNVNYDQTFPSTIRTTKDLLLMSRKTARSRTVSTFCVIMKATMKPPLSELNETPSRRSERASFDSSCRLVIVWSQIGGERCFLMHVVVVVSLTRHHQHHHHHHDKKRETNCWWWPNVVATCRKRAKWLWCFIRCCRSRSSGTSTPF